MFQEGEIDSIGDRVALSQDLGDFARLPVDDARQDQVQEFRQVQAERSARLTVRDYPAALAQAESRRADSLANVSASR